MLVSTFIKAFCQDMSIALNVSGISRPNGSGCFKTYMR